MRNIVRIIILVNALVLGCAGAYAKGNDASAQNDFPKFLSSPQDSNWDGRFGPPGMDSAVTAIAIDDSGNVYVGGYFTTTGVVSANHIAKWNGSSWSALGSGVNGPVYAITVSGSEIYVGGQFTMAGGDSAHYIAKWDGFSWAEPGGGTNGIVTALAASGGNIYAGGHFTMAGGVFVFGCLIAKWDGLSWSALGSGMSNYVNAIAANDNDVYAGGYFGDAGGVNAKYIAKWSGSTWSALGGSVNSFLFAAAISGSDVYAGGAFDSAGGISAKHIAKWNGSAWAGLGGGVNGWVYSIAVKDSDIYIAGEFTTSGGDTVNHIAKWNGSSWLALGSGLDYSVKTIAVSGDSVLYAGGDFLTAGGKPSYYFSIYHDVPTGVEGHPIISGQRAAFKLEQNRPNPFKQFTMINYQLPIPGQVNIKVYNIAGQAVRILANSAQGPGVHSVTWDGRDEGGKRVCAGLYFYKLNAAGVSNVKRLVLVR